MKLIIENKKDLNFSLDTLPHISLPQKVLMVTPTYFDIDNPINTHMFDTNGQPNKINKNKAEDQWKELKEVYEKLNVQVHILNGIENLADMVFCANQSFPYLNHKNQLCAVLSNMRDERRHKEVLHIENFLKTQGYHTQSLASRSEETLFEGMGDVTWLGTTRLLIGGYGFRTSKRIYEALSQVTQYPIAILELKNPKFYHLDTCLSVLNSTTAMVCQEAFTPAGLELLNALFPNLLEIPLREADAPGFACNAHCPDGKHVIIQKNNLQTHALLLKHHFIPIEVDTSEFIKSGGSVYCMKLMYF